MVSEIPAFKNKYSEVQELYKEIINLFLKGSTEDLKKWEI